MAQAIVSVLKTVKEKSMSIVCHKGRFGRSADVQYYVPALSSSLKNQLQQRSRRAKIRALTF